MNDDGDDEGQKHDEEEGQQHTQGQQGEIDETARERGAR